MLVFAGDSFNTDNEYKRLKSLLIGKYTESQWLQNGFTAVDHMCTTLFTIIHCQTSLEAQLCLRSVWLVQNTYCTSLPWMERSTCAATGSAFGIGLLLFFFFFIYDIRKTNLSNTAWPTPRSTDWAVRRRVIISRNRISHKLNVQQQSRFLRVALTSLYTNYKSPNVSCT